jgi:hypothetical protein
VLLQGRSRLLSKYQSMRFLAKKSKVSFISQR